MLSIVIGDEEFFDESTNKFVRSGGQVVEFEHSLISLSKWESKHQKPFLGAGEKTSDEILDYIQFMVISPGVTSEILSRLSQKNLDDINDYIQSKESATTFPFAPERKGKGETITSELIYYWMSAAGIPMETEKWHLHRLFNLIRIFNVKNSKPKKLAPAEAAAQRRELNAQRRRELGTTG